MKRLLSIVAVALISATAAVAQPTYSEFGGSLISPANMKYTDALKFSQQEHTYMSARVAAMGGAFTSLGADLSSMSINPAGLGMYRTSAFAISADLGITTASNNFAPAGKKQTSFAFNQLGTALNLYQGSGALVSFTFGFAYNKLADLNYDESFGWRDDGVSIGDFFALQMEGFPSSVLSYNSDPFRNENIYVDEWGGALAYQTALIDPVKDAEGKETGMYTVTGVPSDAAVAGSLRTRSRGSVGEYSFSSGLNIANILYIGATLGIQDISQTIRYYYAENYTQPSNHPAFLDAMAYAPVESNYGSGVNFKIGAILRPFSALRLGVAYHTRTLTTLTRDYGARMETWFMPNNTGDPTYYDSETLINNYTYNYSSPSKLLLGLSYSLGSRALVSVDYDIVWNRSMTLQSRYHWEEENFKNGVDGDLGTSHNVRVGVEVVPVSGVYLRGGYAHYGSPFNDEAENYADDGGWFYGAYKRSTTNYSLGVGLRFASGSVLDFAWTSSTARYTDSVLYSFYGEYGTDAGGALITDEVNSPIVSDTKHRKSVFTMTYSLLF